MPILSFLAGGEAKEELKGRVAPSATILPAFIKFRREWYWVRLFGFFIGYFRLRVSLIKFYELRKLKFPKLLDLKI